MLLDDTEYDKGSYNCFDNNTSSYQRILTAAQKRSRFFHRLFNFRLMDFQSAYKQMIDLFVSPQKVFRLSRFRNTNRYQFARDDPAFMLLYILLVLVTSLVFMLSIGLSSLQICKSFTWIICMDCIGFSLIMSTLFWFITNKFLVSNVLELFQNTRNDIEWGYCFDIHMNATCPSFFLIHVVQLPFMMLLNIDSKFSTAIGNLVWTLAIFYYMYITFLGYAMLRQIKNAHVFLLPIVPLTLVYLLTVYFNWSLNRLLENFYQWRTV